MINVRRDKWSPSKSAVLCSDHFLEKYLNRTGSYTKLIADAVPTRFKSFPKHLKKVRTFITI